MGIADQRAKFGRKARGIVGMAAGPLTRWEPEVRLTARAEWFGDSADRLVVVVGDHESSSDIDGILASLLGVMGDGTADLVLPEGREEMTLRRMPWITYPIRVWTHRDGVPTEQVVPRECDVRDHFNDDIVTNVHFLHHGDEWLADLFSWADERLHPAHRLSCRSWHHKGRQVLKVRGTRFTVTVEAGVLPPNVVEVTYDQAPAADDDFASIKATVQVGIDNRDSGVPMGVRAVLSLNL